MAELQFRDTAAAGYDRSVGEGIVKLAGFGARSITRQHRAGVHAAIWAQVSCRHTRNASVRARRYRAALIECRRGRKWP